MPLAGSTERPVKFQVKGLWEIFLGGVVVAALADKLQPSPTRGNLKPDWYIFDFTSVVNQLCSPTRKLLWTCLASSLLHLAAQPGSSHLFQTVAQLKGLIMIYFDT